MVIESPLGFQSGQFQGRNTFSGLWSISGRPFPEGLADRIAEACCRVTTQPTQYADVEDFVALGGTE